MFKKGKSKKEKVTDMPHVVDENPSHPVDVDSVESESEIVSEKEAEAMIERHVQKKEAVKAKLEESVDSQDWTMSDPEIPADLVGRVWIAVYRCPTGHKTKATNRQAESGVVCWRCREAGKKVKAVIMDQFLIKPEAPNEDLEKRKKARKGAE